MSRRAAETTPNIETQGAVPVTALPESALPGSVVGTEHQQSLSGSTWQVVGAAVRGVSHERLGMPCQDAQSYQILPDGTLLVAVADGAGSAPFSDLGARCAVREALNSMAAALEGEAPGDVAGWRQLLRETFETARAAVIWLAAKNAAAEAPEATGDPEVLDAPEAPLFPEKDENAEPDALPERAYATTLTCAIATAGRLVVGQIGDGVVVAGEGERLFSVTRLQRGEYANETHFLTQPDALEQMLVEVTEQPVRELAVMSDGLVRLALKMPEQEPHAPFFRPLFRVTTTVGQAGGAPDEADAARQLAAFLGSERVNARTDDDKSLVLAVRVESLRESVEQAPSEERTMNNIQGSGDAAPMRGTGRTPP